jgi:hypothetical protein
MNSSSPSVSSQQKTSSNIKDDYSKNLGVLYTGYLEKKNPTTGSYKKRFVVLTHEAIHWFLRSDGDDLFGEERGKIVLGFFQLYNLRILLSIREGWFGCDSCCPDS